MLTKFFIRFPPGLVAIVLTAVLCVPVFIIMWLRGALKARQAGGDALPPHAPL